MSAQAYNRLATSSQQSGSRGSAMYAGVGSNRPLFSETISNKPLFPKASDTCFSDSTAGPTSGSSALPEQACGCWCEVSVDGFWYFTGSGLRHRYVTCLEVRRVRSPVRHSNNPPFRSNDAIAATALSGSTKYLRIKSRMMQHMTSMIWHHNHTTMNSLDHCTAHVQ